MFAVLQLLRAGERRVLPLIALAALACAPADPFDLPDLGDECVSQDDCSPYYGQTCEAGVCVEQAENESRRLRVDVREVKFLNPRSFRVFVLHPTAPDGTTVRCESLTPSVVRDRARVNRTAPPAELNPGTLGAGQLSYNTLVSLNAPGRLVFVEVFSEAISQSAPGAEGEPIGIGCVEDARFPVEDDREFVVVGVQPA